MKKYMVCVCCMVLSLCCCCLPVYADNVENLPETEVAEDTIEEYIAGELSGDVTVSGETVVESISQAQEDLVESMDGLSQVNLFFGYTIGGIFEIMPSSWTAYITLLVLCMVVVAVVKTID